MSWTLIEVDILCYFCNAGIFRHRSHWRIDWCPACLWSEPYCPFCHGQGVIGTPHEDREYANLVPFEEIAAASRRRPSD